VKIQTIAVSSAPADGQSASDAQVVRLKVSGPIDPDDAVLRRARELVLVTGSAAMIESFDWALRHSTVLTEE
jgi:hypothetical protein